MLELWDREKYISEFSKGERNSDLGMMELMKEAMTRQLKKEMFKTFGVRMSIYSNLVFQIFSLSQMNAM